MDVDEQNEIIRRINKMIADGTTDMGEAEYHNPVATYTDPARHQAEVDRLFREAPLAVGHVSEVRAPGDFKTVTIAGIPILVTRDRSGQVRAYKNVCGHRGTLLVEEARGNARSFACSYHAWTYSSDGRLLNMPDAIGFPCVSDDKASAGLTELWAREVGGFVYVRPDGHAPDLDIDSWAGEVSDDFDFLGLPSYDVFAPSGRSWPINWKLPLDIFLENYHTKFTHRDTIYPVFQQNTGTFDRLGAHIRCVLPKRSIVDLEGQPEEGWSLIDHATILYTLFPNTMIAVLPHHVAIWHIYPDGVGSCTADFYTLISEQASTPKAKAEWEKSLHVVGQVEAEDTARAESIQQTLHSGALEHLTFGRFEKALAWHHQMIGTALTDGIGALAVTAGATVPAH